LEDLHKLPSTNTKNILLDCRCSIFNDFIKYLLVVIEHT